MSAKAHSRQRSLSNQRSTQPQPYVWKGKENASPRISFEPCAATGSLFLYAEGSTVICVHHDTLAIERVFDKHTEDIQFICVDNVSERGQGSLVVTYDIGQTAIVWDLLTGEQISRFASFDALTVAAWMRNGNLTFGNEKGDLILFEPSSSEHVSARTIFDPITAIAPSADCKTFAIGYRNGSILLATLQPSFTILHTLSTSRAPSQISALSWHASSSKQKSDMLATNTVDGDLRVWSVAKPPGSSQPRIIRSLHRSDSFIPSQSWISWSKNGRIIQLYEGVTWSWDVRTKDVTYHSIPTVEYIRGIAAYGPTGTLFTLGPDHTVQQYDVDIPQMVANVRHPPRNVPQTPPQALNPASLRPGSDYGFPTPQRELRFGNETANAIGHRTELPQSTHRRSHSHGSQPADGRVHELASPIAKTEKTTTTMSLGVQSQPHELSQSPSSNRSARKQSKLRQEVALSPLEKQIPELFPFTRARLSDVPYQHPRATDDTSLTPDDLRKQMLKVVFGWHDDIESLINDELNRHPPNSPNAVFLARWLGIEPNRVADVFKTGTFDASLDWMRLALNSISNQPGTKKMAQTFTQNLLTQGDIHAAVCLLMAIGEYNDAIEVYVSSNFHMEAILLTCLLMPSDWQRQSHLVRRWGEHVVQQSQQHLAVRCFSCTSVEPTEPWTSPTAQLATQTIPEHPNSLQPSIYHKTMVRRGTQELSPQANLAPPVTFTVSAPSKPNSTAQDGGLKLITSFGKNNYKFPGLMSDEGTPINAALVTPIAESALPRSAVSPGGFGSYRMNNIRSLNGALAARAGTPNALQRNRLPSIGEAIVDVDETSFVTGQISRAPLTPADSGSDKEKGRPDYANQAQKSAQLPLPSLLTPSHYDPMAQMVSETPQTAVASQSSMSFAESAPSETQRSASARPAPRGNSRTRKPEGLSVSTTSTQESNQSQELLLPSVYGESIQRPATTTATFVVGKAEISPPHTGNSLASLASLNSLRSAKSQASIGGRSLDQYISSLEQAQYYKPTRSRGNSAASKQLKDEVSERKSKYLAKEQDNRSRSQSSSVQPAKRSPASPVPMSPEELQFHSTSVDSFDSVLLSTSSHQNRSDNRASTASGSRAEDDVRYAQPRQRSRSRAEGRSQGNSRTVSQQRSPEHEPGTRGRSKSRKEESATRSPESPIPMIPSEEDLQNSQLVDPALRFVAQNRQRLNRSANRRDSSTDRRSTRMRSRSRQPEAIDTSLARKSSISIRSEQRHAHEDSLDSQTSHSAAEGYDRASSTSEADRINLKNLQHLPHGRRRELAQAELEARRLSLVRRPSAPVVPLPGQNVASSLDFAPPLLRAQTDQGLPTLSSFALPHSSRPESAGFGRTRPQTPRAMKHPSHGQTSVPELPSMGEFLDNSHYQVPSLPASMTMSPQKGRSGSFTSPEIPFDMPTHPAFDASIATSRPGSQNTRHHTASPARGASRERRPLRDTNTDFTVMTIGEDSNSEAEVVYVSPPVVPELQHLAVPPPPPPPPQIPMQQEYQKHPFNSGLRIQTDSFPIPSNIPLPSSAYPVEPTTAISPTHHQRDRSVQGKIRNIAGRMRSSSRGRSQSRPRNDNTTRSPNIGGEEHTSPYESINPSQMTYFHLNTVAEGR